MRHEIPKMEESALHHERHISMWRVNLKAKICKTLQLMWVYENPKGQYPGRSCD
jgi:hypothetical protein